ncbi:MAG: glycosyltransferase [Prevotella sp.]|nr:glycosyltransferase [Prevotella sp.]
MNDFPKVTVVTVCKNAKPLLEKTVRSVLAQQYKPIDYLVIDGASTDGTLDLLSRTDGFRWISEPDKGIYDAMNKGIGMAEGEWIVFMNAGDAFADDDTLQKVFSEKRNADVIYGDVVKGSTIKRAEPPHNSHRMFYCHQSCLVRTECLREYPFDISHKMSADFKQTKQLYLAGKRFLQLDFPIANFDLSGISNTKRSKGIDDNIRVVCEVDRWTEKIRLLPRLLFTYWMCKMRGK